MKLFWLYLRNRYYQRHLRRKDLPASIRDYLQGFVRLDLKKLISETEFVALDTETTGLRAKKGDRIVSISAVRLKKARIDLSDTFHALINPNRDIPPAAAVVHEILPRMVNGKPGIESVLPDFLQYVGDAVLVAHHAWLDLSFLDYEMNRLFGFPLCNIVLDTALLDQALVAKRFPFMLRTMRLDSTLTAVAERYHVLIEGHHSSFGDALATAQIFQTMVKQAERHRIVYLKDLLRMTFTPPSFAVQHAGGVGT